MKRILITGSAGFIGRGLARHFKMKGDQVYGIDRTHAENAPLADLTEYVQMDLPSPAFDDLLKRWAPDVVLHCAGRASVVGSMQNPLLDFQDGPVLIFSLLASIREIRPECAFILFSSAAVYGNPVSLPIHENAPVLPVSSYGYHKWQGEIICQEYAGLWDIKTASIRIFSAYGPGLRRQVLWDIMYKALNHSEILLQGTGRESRDFIHVQDIAQSTDIVLNKAAMSGEIYNVASGRETQISDLAQLIVKKLDVNSKIVFSGDLPAGTPKTWKADINKIAALGFKCEVSLEQGVQSFVEWARREMGYI